jgi:hypothetical protein
MNRLGMNFQNWAAGVVFAVLAGILSAIRYLESLVGAVHQMGET